jgi:5-methylcytosine-specific restriction endonuclease McrA
MSIIVACAVIQRDGHQCVYCLKALVIKTNDAHSRAELDHIIPRNDGGLAVATNLVTSCRKCNMKRRWGKLEPRHVFNAIDAAHRPIDMSVGRKLALQHYPSRVKPLRRGVAPQA